MRLFLILLFLTCSSVFGQTRNVSANPSTNSLVWPPVASFKSANSIPSGTGTITGTSSGTNTGDQINISGNAATATALQTPRTINGVPFDGTSNIVLPAGGDMLLGTAQVVTASKTFNDLTFFLRNVANTFNASFSNTNTANRVYTLQDATGTLALTSDITGINSGTNTGDQTTISGNAGSATVLATPRNINGVPFDGSSNITVTAAGSTLSDDVPYANIQDISVTDRVLGRSTAGSGPTEEIPFTAGARAMSAKVAPWGVYNASVSTVSAAFATDTYLVGSECLIPDGSLQAKSMYHCVFNVEKTNAGTQTPIINLRFGTNGSTADASRGTFTFTAGTAAADQGTFEIWATFRTVGSGSSAVIQGLAQCRHRLSVTGITGTAAVSEPEIATSAGFDSTVSSSIIGVSVNGGTSASWTVSLVQSKLFNLQ